VSSPPVITISCFVCWHTYSTVSSTVTAKGLGHTLFFISFSFSEKCRAWQWRHSYWACRQCHIMD